MTGPAASAIGFVELMKKWLGNLEHAAHDAQLAGEIKKEVDVRQLAFEIQALAMGANWSSRLFRDQTLSAGPRCDFCSGSIKPKGPCN